MADKGKIPGTSAPGIKLKKMIEYEKISYEVVLGGTKKSEAADYFFIRFEKGK